MPRRKLNDLNLLDDFLFGTVVGHPVWGELFSRLLLETIFQKKFGKLKVVPQKIHYGKDTDLHGTRLDVFVETPPGEDIACRASVYDMEPDQKKGTLQEVSRRTRLYHALIDADCLKSGENYTSLKDVFVIFIMPHDPFGAERMVYTIRNTCLEEPEFPYDDGAQTIFLYTRGTKGNPPEALRQLLCYMEKTRQEYAVNEKLKQLHHIIEAVKQNKEVELSYMKSWEWEQQIREEAFKSGREEERRNTERERQRAHLAEAELEKLRRALRQHQQEPY